MNSVWGRARLRGPHDRIPELPPHPASTVLTTGRSTHATRMMLVDGRPALVSAMLVRPANPGTVRTSGTAPVLISLRYLGRDFAEDLETRYLLEKARFSPTPAHRPNEYALALRSDDGGPLAYLIWEPELPGSRILETMLPVAAVLLATLGLLTFLLVRGLRQSLEERAAFEAHAAHLAFHDALTGLPNRALLRARMEERLAQPKRVVHPPCC